MSGISLALTKVNPTGINLVSKNAPISLQTPNVTIASAQTNLPGGRNNSLGYTKFTNNIDVGNTVNAPNANLTTITASNIKHHHIIEDDCQRCPRGHWQCHGVSQHWIAVTERHNNHGCRCVDLSDSCQHGYDSDNGDVTDGAKRYYSKLERTEFVDDQHRQ